MKPKHPIPATPRAQQIFKCEKCASFHRLTDFCETCGSCPRCGSCEKCAAKRGLDG